MANAEMSPRAIGPAKPMRHTKVKYCNSILEQGQRRIKRITDPMLGFKSFDAADIINGIEAYAMLRKGQSIFATDNGRAVSFADQYYKIATQQGSRNRKVGIYSLITASSR